MTRARELGQRARRAQDKAIIAADIPALFGKVRANGDISLRGDTTNGDLLPTNQVYVRLYTLDIDVPRVAYCTAVTPKAGSGVFVKENYDGTYSCVRLWDKRATEFLGVQAVDYAGPTASGAKLELQRTEGLMAARLYFVEAGTLKVNVMPFWYIDSGGNRKQWVPTLANTVDLNDDDGTDHVPASSGGLNQHSYAVIDFNPDASAPALVVASTTTKPTTAPLLNSDIEAVALTSPHLPLWALRLTTGDSAPEDVVLDVDPAKNDWVDLRFWSLGGTAGSSTSAGIVYADDNLSNPPTETGLFAALPDAVDEGAGYAALLDDAGAHQADYLAAWDGGFYHDIPLARAPVNATSAIAADAYADTDTVNGHLKASSIVSQVIGGVAYQVFGYWDDDDKLAFAWRSLPGRAWTIYTTAVTLSTADFHNFIALGLDSDGYLHVVYDTHAQALKYRRSTLTIDAFDGTLTDALAMLGTNETSVTYPTFINDNDGLLYFLFRDGGSGNGDLYMYAYATATTTWSAAAGTSTAGLLIDGSGDSPYWWMPQFDDANDLHLFFCWRATTDWTTNYDISYAKWDGTNWTQMGGGAQTIPITPSNDGVAKALSAGSGLLNSGWSDVDGNERPHMVYLREDGDGYLNPFHLYHNGTNWVDTQLLTTETPVPSGPSAWLETDLAEMNRPVIVIDRATNIAYVFFVATDEGVGLWLLQSAPNDFTTWTKVNVYTGDVGAWEPQYDRLRWQRDGVLDFPVAEWFTGLANDVTLFTYAPNRAPEYQRIIAAVGTESEVEGIRAAPGEMQFAYNTATDEVGVSRDGGLTWTWIAGGIAGHTIRDNGSAKTQRAALNFLSGSGITSAAADDAGNNETEVTHSLNLNGLVEDTSPDSTTDFVATYDTSASAHKKVRLDRLPTSVRTVFIQTEDATVANTTTETTLLAGGQGSKTLPANALAVGSTLRLMLGGYISDTGNPTINIKVYLGGVEICATGADALDTSVTEVDFHLEVLITCRSVGATGTVVTSGLFEHDNGTSFGLTKTTATTVDTASALEVDVTATWGTADPADTLTTQIATIELMTPLAIATTDELLLESGDALLLESGDTLLLEG